MVLQAHAPSEMRFSLEPGRYRIHGSFGVRAEAYERGTTDGVAFVVALEGTNRQPEELFRSWLRPKERPEDRGPKVLDERFTLAAPGTLILITGPGPEREADWDWAYWSGVRIARDGD